MKLLVAETQSYMHVLIQKFPTVQYCTVQHSTIFIHQWVPPPATFLNALHVCHLWDNILTLIFYNVFMTFFLCPKSPSAPFSLVGLKSNLSLYRLNPFLGRPQPGGVQPKKALPVNYAFSTHTQREPKQFCTHISRQKSVLVY